MDPSVTTSRQYQMTEATIEGAGGDELTTEVLRALRELGGRRARITISVQADG